MVISLISLAHVEEEPTPECPVACFGDLQPFDFERLPPFADHVLSSRGSESYAHQLCQLVGREAVHAHDVFGAASRAATGEQRKRAALMGLWGARWSRARHRVIESDLLILTQRLRLGKIPRNRASSLRARQGEAGALTRHQVGGRARHAPAQLHGLLGGVKKAFRSEVAVAKSMSPISAAKLGVTGQTVMAMSLSLAQDRSHYAAQGAGCLLSFLAEHACIYAAIGFGQPAIFTCVLRSLLPNTNRPAAAHSSPP
jgi:hypothetical protein